MFRGSRSYSFSKYILLFYSQARQRYRISHKEAECSCIYLLAHSPNAHSQQELGVGQAGARRWVNGCSFWVFHVLQGPKYLSHQLLLPDVFSHSEGAFVKGNHAHQHPHILVNLCQHSNQYHPPGKPGQVRQTLLVFQIYTLQVYLFIYVLVCLNPTHMTVFFPLQMREPYAYVKGCICFILLQSKLPHIR